MRSTHFCEGPPLLPALQVQTVTATQFRVSWDQPFSWTQFPVLDYTVAVYNGSRLLTQDTTTDRNYSFWLDTEVNVCTLLTFEVSARNEVGVSNSGTTQAGINTGSFGDFQHNTKKWCMFQCSTKDISTLCQCQG